MAPRTRPAFGVWITGLPASGKSTLASALKAQLAARGVNIAVLESDELRKIFTPSRTITKKNEMLFMARWCTSVRYLRANDVPVLFDATANRRAYRDLARRQIPRFLEVYVDTPLETCAARDPKGIYRLAQGGKTNTVPGMQAEYEAPERSDLTIHGDRESPESAAGKVIAKLTEREYL